MEKYWIENDEWIILKICPNLHNKGNESDVSLNVHPKKKNIDNSRNGGKGGSFGVWLFVYFNTLQTI